MRVFAIICSLLFLAGCGGMKVSDFAANEPKFDLFSYFDGKVKAYGFFEDRFGTIKRQFTVDIIGTIDGNQITLEEDFFFMDGEKDRRVWVITKTGEGEYEGRAGDVIGTAIGRSAGNALSWRYDLDLKVGDGTIRVHFDDWMVLQDDRVMLNRASVSKWGFNVGEVTLAFVKE